MKKEIDGNITILCDGNKVQIWIEDSRAVCQFLRVELTPSQFTALLGGFTCVPCKLQLKAVDKLGKIREVKPLVFVVPHLNLGITRKLAKENVEGGWEPELDFNSQGSFHTENGIHYARTRQLRWVDPE